jgi:3-isopropylmalate/(R)-2-methylmalate dehydratase large subunit
MADALRDGAVRLTDAADAACSSTDRSARRGGARTIVLHLLALPRSARAGVGQVFEFRGSAVASMSIDERATLTNMTAELGGVTGIVAPDAETCGS